MMHDEAVEATTVHSLPFKLLGICYSTSRQEALKEAFELMNGQNRHISVKLEAAPFNIVDSRANAVLQIAKFMFRYHNNLLPPLFLNLFMANSQVHRYDTRTAGNYRAHSCRTNIKKFTILYQGPRVWNSLPSSITNLSSFSTFKNKVLEFSFLSK